MGKLLNSLILIAALFMVASCGKKKPVIKLPELPKTPDGQLLTLSEEMSKGHAEMVTKWLPPKYVKDINEVVQLLAGKIEPHQKVYDKLFVIADKISQVMEKKREFLVDFVDDNDIGQKNIRKNFDENWASAVFALKTLAKSEISSIDKLKKFDLTLFMRNTGTAIMMETKKHASKSSDKEVKAFFSGEKVSAKVIKEDGKAASVEMTSPGGKKEIVELVNVDGHWVPKTLAENWDKSMEAAKKAISEMKDAEIKKQLPEIVGQLSGFETALDQMLAAKTKEEFESVSVLSGLAKARMRSHQINDKNNLKTIGLALLHYADENDGKFPTKLSDLWRKKYLTNGTRFVSPASNTKVPQTADDIDKGMTDYVYVAGGGSDADFNAETGIAFTKPGVFKKYTNVVFGDGHVKGYKIPDSKDIKTIMKFLNDSGEVLFNKMK